MQDEQWQIMIRGFERQRVWRHVHRQRIGIVSIADIVSMAGIVDLLIYHDYYCYYFK